MLLNSSGKHISFIRKYKFYYNFKDFEEKLRLPYQVRRRSFFSKNNFVSLSLTIKEFILLFSKILFSHKKIPRRKKIESRRGTLKGNSKRAPLSYIV